GAILGMDLRHRRCGALRRSPRSRVHRRTAHFSEDRVERAGRPPRLMHIRLERAPDRTEDTMSVGRSFTVLSSAALLAAMLASPAGAHSPGNSRGYFGPGPGSDPRIVKSLGPKGPSGPGLIRKPGSGWTPYNPWYPRWVIGPHVRRIP